jgi:outer membrane protein assembly factor BamB
MTARTVLPACALVRSRNHEVPHRGVSSGSRPLVLLTLIGLVASIALSAAVTPLASAAPATATLTGEWPPIPLTGTFVGLSPARLLDTRPGAPTTDGRGSGAGVIGGGRTLVVPVVGRAGIAAGAVAVVVNITEASATASSFLTLYPAGSSRPGTSNLNFPARAVTSVEATVPVGNSGAIAVYNRAGSVNAVIDVVGYYAGATDTYAASAYHAVAPTRLVDTRRSSPLASGHFLPLHLPSLPAAESVALNITVTGPTTAGYLAVWQGVAHQSTHTSALNFAAGATVANMAITTTAWDPVNNQRGFSVANVSAGPVNVIVDVVGYYTQLYNGPGAVFKAITPTRVVDTRIGKGLPRPLGAAASAAAATSTVFGDVDTVAMVANATGLDDPSSTYLSVYPAGTSVPGTSSLNLAPRQTASNMVMPALSSTSTRSFALYNHAGTLDTLVDVVGFFEKTGNRRSITTVRSSSTSSTYDTALILTASVVGNGGTPTGTVTFTDASNGSILAVEPLSGGVASLATAALAPGTRKIVAAYKGPTLTSPSLQNAFSSSVSTALPITVAPPRATVATAFQGNSRHDGMDLGDTFKPATLHQAWSIDFNPASGSWDANVSYPLIAGGRVFVTVGPRASPERNADTLYALDATTGSVDWQAPIATYYGIPVLTYDGGQVFVQDFDGILTAYDAATGHLNWTTTLTPAAWYTGPPTAYDGVLYASGSGILSAVSEANGEVVWTSLLNGAGGQSSPAVDDSGVYAGTDNWCGKVSAFALDGTSRWTNGLSACSSSFGTTSVLNDRHLFVPGMYRGAEQIPGRIVSADTGLGGGSLAGRRMPAFDAANLYVVREVAGGSVLDALFKAGSQTRWSFTGDGAISTTPVTTNGIVFTGSVAGNVYGIDSSTGAQVWAAVAPGPVFTAAGDLMTWGLAAADGLLAVPAGGFLTVYTN